MIRSPGSRTASMLVASLALSGWLLCAAAVFGHDGSGAAASSVAGSVGQVWDFTLPTLDGSRFVQASALNGPVLVNFWGRDCAPCIAELPRLAAFAQSHPQWTVLLISTDAPADAREFAQKHRVSLTILRRGANVAALMRRAGNDLGGLPFTVALWQSRVCDRQLGEVSASHLQRIEAACVVKSPP